MTISSKFVALIAALFFSVFALSACNTVEGVGQDIEAGGDAIEDAAERNKNY